MTDEDWGTTVTDAARWRAFLAHASAGGSEDGDLFSAPGLVSLADMLSADAFFYLPATRSRANRLLDAVNQRAPHSTIGQQIGILREALEDELKDRQFFYMPAGRSVMYNAQERLLGPEVAAAFPDVLTDVDEAGKCLACGRQTAGVFHLMRVLEAGLQTLGSKLNVQLVEQKNWQNILDEMNKAIRALPKGPQQTALAEFGALLYSVKLAWRNEVMHPKATYSEEEANTILQSVKAFMAALAKLVAPQATATAGQLATSAAAWSSASPAAIPPSAPE